MSEYNDEQLPRDTDPTHWRGVEDFPFEGMDERLGWKEPEEAAHGDLDPIRSAAKRTDEGIATRLFQFLLEDLSFEKRDGRRSAAIGNRVIGFAWQFNPALVGGKSLSQIAKFLKISTMSLSRHSADARRQFPTLINGGNAHGHSFKADKPRKHRAKKETPPAVKQPEGVGQTEAASPGATITT